MHRADQATIDLLTDYFDAMEAKNFDRLGSYYADDISLTFANAPTITGRDAMLDQMTTLLGKVTSLAHPLINVWQEDDGVVIFEVTSIWRFHDDTVIRSTPARSSPSPTTSSPTNASTSTTPPSTASSRRQRWVCSQNMAIPPPWPTHNSGMSRSPWTMSRDHVDVFCCGSDRRRPWISSARVSVLRGIGQVEV